MNLKRVEIFLEYRSGLMFFKSAEKDAMKNNVVRIFLFLLLMTAVSMLEILACKFHGGYSIIASRVWLLWTIFYFSSSLFFATRVIWGDVKERSFWGLVVLSIVGLIVFWKIDSVDFNSSHEATQQVGAALRAINQKDYSYTGVAFLGYPVRQYIIAAVPSFFMGRTLLALRLGYALPFFLGLIMFYIGLLSALKSKSSQGHYWAALAVISITAFPFVIQFLRNYEQVIFPIAFGMQCVGWLLLFLNKPTFFRAINLVYVASFLAVMYPPGLAAWCLFLVFLVGSLFEKGGKKDWEGVGITVACILPAVIIGISSFLYRRDNVGRLFLGTEWGRLLKEGFGDFFFSSPEMYLSPIMAFPVVFYLVASVSGLLRPRDFVISLWALGVVAVSVISTGYCSFPPSFALLRTIVIVPPILAGMAFTLAEWFSKRGYPVKRRVFIVLLILVTAHSLFLLNKSLLVQKASLKDFVLQDMVSQAKQNNLSQEETINIALFLSSVEFINLPDHLVYFFPRYKWVFNPRESLQTVFDPRAGSLLYFDREHPVLTQFIQTRKYSKEKLTFPSRDGGNIEIFRIVVVPDK